MRSILAIFAGMIVGFIFANRVIVWMTSKATSVDPRAHIITIEPAEGFITYFKVAAYIGMVIASPILFYQIVRFMAPGILPHELKYLLWGIPIASFLFIAGVLFANLYVIPSFLEVPRWLHLRAEFRFYTNIGKYLILLLAHSVGIGLIFQLPAALFLLGENPHRQYRQAAQVAALRLRRFAPSRRRRSRPTPDSLQHDDRRDADVRPLRGRHGLLVLCPPARRTWSLLEAPETDGVGVGSPNAATITHGRNPYYSFCR